MVLYNLSRSEVDDSKFGAPRQLISNNKKESSMQLMGTNETLSDDKPAVCQFHDTNKIKLTINKEGDQKDFSIFDCDLETSRSGITHSKDPLIMVCVLFQKSQSNTLFVFACQIKDNIERLYLFVTKTNKELKNILIEDTPIIGLNEKVEVFRGYQTLSKNVKEKQFKFETIYFRELIETENSSIEHGHFKSDQNEKSLFKSNKNIKLSFPTLSDEKKKQNFAVFVYQEQNNMLNNRMIVYDIPNKKIVNNIFINPPQNQIDQVNKDENDFLQYQICRSSDIEEEKPPQSELEG